MVAIFAGCWGFQSEPVKETPKSPETQGTQQTQATQSPSTSAFHSMVVIPKVGVGPLLLGMAEKDIPSVEKTLGMKRDASSDTSCYKYLSSGIEVAVFGGKIRVITFHDRVDEKNRRGFNNWECFPGKTDRGISIGDDYTQVLEKYGKPDSEQPFPHENQICYKQMGIRFIISVPDKKVVGFSIFGRN
jgi:hypothetical protein